MAIDRNYWRCSNPSDPGSPTTTVAFDEEDSIVTLTNAYGEYVFITINDLIEIVESIKNG
jgi:hypothetical protein